MTKLGNAYTHAADLIDQGLTPQQALRKVAAPGVFKLLSEMGGDPNGKVDSTEAFQAALNLGGILCLDGIFLISDTLTISKPIHLCGGGNSSQILVSSAMGATTDVIEINPDLTEDKYQWTFQDFYVKAQSGTPARHVFHVDITTTNKFLAKHNIDNVRADEFGGDYLNLTNPTNVDGLFTSSYVDNFCNNGIDLSDRSGDSLIFERNTHTGDGVGPAFTIEQVSGASHIVISRSNITSSGGALSIVWGRNIILQDSTVECPNTFDGDNNALVNVDGIASPTTYTSNTKILNNNINTQGNATRCIYVDYATRTTIQGNTLFCDPATDVHVYVDTKAYNTIIGENNRFLNSTTGAETTPLITDNGIGTMGILKDYTITLSGWDLIDATNNHAAQFIKDADGMVTLFGALDGPATGVADTLFTLPLGFRPAKIVKFWSHDRQ